MPVADVWFIVGIIEMDGHDTEIIIGSINVSF